MSDLDSLLDEREKYIRSLFASLFYIVAILVGPSIIAAFIGNEINARFGSGKLFTFCLVLFSMGLSWYFVFGVYKKIDKKIIELDNKIKLEKEKSNDGK